MQQYLRKKTARQICFKPFFIFLCRYTYVYLNISLIQGQGKSLLIWLEKKFHIFHTHKHTHSNTLVHRSKTPSKVVVKEVLKNHTTLNQRRQFWQLKICFLAKNSNQKKYKNTFFLYQHFFIFVLNNKPENGLAKKNCQKLKQKKSEKNEIKVWKRYNLV